MRGSSPRMTPIVLPARSVADSIIKQPAFAKASADKPAEANAARAGLARLAPGQALSPLFFAGAGHAVLSSLTPQTEGDGAPRSAAVSFPCRAPARSAGASRRSVAAISDPGSALPGTRPMLVIGPRRAGSTPEHVVGSAPALRRPVQRAPRRRVVVPNGRFPGPPECEVTNPARGRRIPRRRPDVTG